MEMLTAAHGVRNLASLLKTKLNERRMTLRGRAGGGSSADLATPPAPRGLARSVARLRPGILTSRAGIFLCKGGSPARWEGPSEAQELRRSTVGSKRECCWSAGKRASKLFRWS